MQVPVLIESIRSLLEGRLANSPADVVALEYASLCREVNDRLEKISLMLESGGEIQALQMAEQPPRVLDSALALSFGGEGAWQDYCRDQGHEIAPMIDARTLDALMEIQNKGITPNHPLYKEYRTAISKRDDVNAFHLIRVIARMNPGDENAAKELKRLQRKALQASLAKLKSSLDGNDAVLLDAMARVEEAAVAEEYEATPEWRQAAAARSRIRRMSAWQKMPFLLQDAEDQMREGDWRQAALHHGEFEGLVLTHGMDTAMADGMEARSKSITAALAICRAEAERVAATRKLVAEMEHIANDVETRTVTPLGLSREFSEPLIEQLAHKMRQLETLRGEFPEISRRRVDAAFVRLTQSLERINRGRRIRWVAGISIALMLLISGAVLGAFALRSSAHAKLLADLRQKQSTSGLRDLILRITSEEPLLLKFPSLATEVAEARQWLETVDAKRSVADGELSALEEIRAVHFSGISSRDLFAKLRESGEQISALPDDVAEEAAARLSVVRNDGERIIATRQGEEDGKARDLVARWNTILERIDPEGPSMNALDAIKPATQELDPYLNQTALEHPSLRLPASTSTMLEDLQARLDTIRQRVEAVSACHRALERVATAEEYREAMVTLASTTFSESAAAQRVVDAWMDADRMKALMVFRGDLTALKAAEADDQFGAPVPESANAEDRSVISSLSQSTALNKLWFLEWEDLKGKAHRGLSEGEMRPDGITGKRGKVSDYPKPGAAIPFFAEREMYPHEGKEVIRNQETPISKLMLRLSLMDLLDNTGAKFRSSVLPALDTIANDKDAHPLAKAYVFGRLLTIVRNRDVKEWGIHYCPEMIDDMAAYDALAMKAPLNEWSWLIQDKENVLLPWKEYFSSRGERSSYSQLIKTRNVARDVIQNSLRLVGRVSGDGSIIFDPGLAKQLVLGMKDSGDGTTKMAVCGVVDSNGKWNGELPSFTPYSPLFSIDLKDETLEYLTTIHQQKIKEQEKSEP
jgi:hypothetical protein